MSGPTWTLRSLAIFATAVAAITGLAGAPGAVFADKPMALMEKLALMQVSYPETIFAVTNNTMRLMSGRILLVEDGREKSHRERFDQPDVEDTLAQVYPLGKCYRGRRKHADPGRIRHELFFREAYGYNQHRVGAQLAQIDWFGTRIAFSTRHGAGEALLRVRDELARLPRELHETFRRPAVAFAWRTHQESDVLSPHAFGIAIELDAEFSHGWRHRVNEFGRVKRYRNKVPAQVVEVFERHGFIWGGKWYHYDTGHFEYRPELIAIGRLDEARGCPSAVRDTTDK